MGVWKPTPSQHHHSRSQHVLGLLFLERGLWRPEERRSGVSLNKESKSQGELGWRRFGPKSNPRTTEWGARWGGERWNRSPLGPWRAAITLSSGRGHTRRSRPHGGGAAAVRVAAERGRRACRASSSWDLAAVGIHECGLWRSEERRSGLSLPMESQERRAGKSWRGGGLDRRATQSAPKG